MKVSQRSFSYLIAAMAVLAGGCADPSPLTPPTPPLLQNVSGAGGWWNAGCPPRDAAEAQIFQPPREALSPELMERLTRQLPVSSDASRLQRTLREQGFSFHLPCESLPSIHL